MAGGLSASQGPPAPVLGCGESATSSGHELESGVLSVDRLVMLRRSARRSVPLECTDVSTKGQDVDKSQAVDEECEIWRPSSVDNLEAALRSFGLDADSDTTDVATQAVEPEVDEVALEMMTAADRRAYVYRERRLASADYGFVRSGREASLVDDDGEWSGGPDLVAIPSH